MTADASPFHAGEQRVQERLGVRAIEDFARQVVRPYLPEQHREFHTALPFLVAAARDGAGRPWATLLTGGDGFVASPDPQTLEIAARPGTGDALEGALTPGTDLGLLGIELATRRRNRVNGRVTADRDGAVVFAVDQSFGNCPQYIRERTWRRVEEHTAGPAVRSSRLSGAQRNWIAAADTFFIASGHRGEGTDPAYGMDASHRGGDPGFVHVASDASLVFPDYAGNNHFNTIGNLAVDPRVGLLFVDFESGSLLQLTGRARIDWGSEALAQHPGARRLVHVAIEDIVERPRGLPLRWNAEAGSVRSLRLVDKIRESDDVTSFVFEARDGGALPAFEAGQHLPLEIEVPDRSEPVRRTYSLSGDPGAGHYRISVKREPKGAASRHLHDRVEPGAILSSRKPAGDFVLSCSTCPVVLVSAGVGLTPMVSLLHTLAAEAGERAVWFVHGARDGRHHPLAEEVRTLLERRPGLRSHVRFSQPGAQDQRGRDYDSEGRIDGALLSGLVEAEEAHYFLCGPIGFMASVQADLEARGIAPERIHRESFGPAAG